MAMFKASSNNKTGGKSVKSVLWPCNGPDATYTAFSEYIQTLPGYHRSNPTVADITISTSPTGQKEMQKIDAGVDAALPYHYADKETITFAEVFPFKGTDEQMKDIARQVRLLTISPDVFVLFGSPLSKLTNGHIIEFTVEAENGVPVLYFVGKSQLAQAKQDIKTLHLHDRKHLIVSSLPDKVVPAEMDQMIKTIISAASGTLNQAEIDLSAARIAISAIHVLRGKDLMVADVTGKSDPFCKIYLGQKFGAASTQVHTTKVKKQTLSPVWTDKDKNCVRGWDFGGKHAADTLFIEIWDEDTVGADRMGFCSIPVASLTLGDLELKVKPVKKEKACGTLFIRVE